VERGREKLKKKWERGRERGEKWREEKKEGERRRKRERGWEREREVRGKMGRVNNLHKFRGQADGFVISMLPKLADTKSGFDKNTSLLSYIAKYLYKIRPTLLALGAEPKLQEAAKVPFAEVENAINSLATGIPCAYGLPPSSLLSFLSLLSISSLLFLSPIYNL
jgi:hypothetical protein